MIAIRDNVSIITEVGKIEFNEKLQTLRKEKNLTQEQLAELLFVSRTAISKWESGRGYPSIESLKMLSIFFNVSIDDLLSGEEIISVAQNENQEKTDKMRSLIFGIVDLMTSLLFVLPIFGMQEADMIFSVSLLELHKSASVTAYLHFLAIVLTTAAGIFELALQNIKSVYRSKIGKIISMSLTVFCLLVFVLSRQPYPGVFMIFMLITKGLIYSEKLFRNR